jgi:hypothetical protein
MGQPWIHKVSSKLGGHTKPSQLPANFLPVGADEIRTGSRQPRGVLGIGMAATGLADRRHAGGDSALDTEGRVLDDDAVNGIGVHPGGGELADPRS